jgi:hypothetical protein
MNQIPGLNYGKCQRNMLIRNPGLALNRNILFFMTPISRTVGQKMVFLHLRGNIIVGLALNRFMEEI